MQSVSPSVYLTFTCSIFWSYWLYS